jgi:hypothetical protein
MTNRRARLLVRITVFTAFAILIAGNRAIAQDRGGFTALVDFGAGVQHDSGLEESAFRLAGVSFGVGGFLTDDLALMFRLAGTTVDYDLNGFEYGQSSGFVGPSLQYWLSDRLNVETGAGVGFWRGDTDEDNLGFGLLLGAGYSIFNRGKHNLQLGVHYAPAFTDPGTVHNLGFTFGYQFQ